MLEAALWVVLAVNGARLAWLLLASPPSPEAAPFPSVAAAPVAFPDADPFYPAADPTGDAATVSLEGYALHGVRHANGEGEGSAIVSDPQGRQRAFRVGDTVSAGVVLHAVGPTHAVLSVNDRHHRLELPQVTGVLGAGRAAVAGNTVPR